MHNERRKARDWLNDCTKSVLIQMLEEIKISDNDMEILDMKFIHGYSNVQIANKANCSVETVNRIIGKTYDKVSKFIGGD